LRAWFPLGCLSLSLGGKEAADQILARRPDTRILYVSGYTRDAISRHGVLDEGVDFIAKPFTPETLQARVREMLDRAPRADEGAPRGPPRPS
jgi:DNA-binding response OmpR family regulator